MARLRYCALGSAAVLTAVSCLGAADGKKNPTSKFFVADLNGEAQVQTGNEIDDLTKKSVYNAEGTVIETKANSNYAMVYSNGTGIYFDPLTRLEVRQFQQEPFRPNRTDMEVEPSVSQTQAFMDRGFVGLCTSKLVAGSNMTYVTPQGSVNVRNGRKLTIEVGDNETKISMIEGESTVLSGDGAGGGQTLHDGQQAIIRPGLAGQPNQVTISDIPKDESSSLDDKVTAACLAKKTVYFEVKGKTGVDAFDASATNGSAAQQIVAVPVVPASLPVQFTISPANLVGQ